MNVLNSDYLNEYRQEYHSTQENELPSSDPISDLIGLKKLRKDYSNNPMIGYLNINSLKKK